MSHLIYKPVQTGMSCGPARFMQITMTTCRLCLEKITPRPKEKGTCKKTSVQRKPVCLLLLKLLSISLCCWCNKPTIRLGICLLSSWLYAKAGCGYAFRLLPFLKQKKKLPQLHTMRQRIFTKQGRRRAHCLGESHFEFGAEPGSNLAPFFLNNVRSLPFYRKWA